MGINPLLQNAKTLNAEIQWLATVIDTQISLYWQRESPYKKVTDIEPPDLRDNSSVYAQFVNHYRLGFNERIILMLALAPHIQPNVLDVFFVKNANYDRPFTEFGGVKGKQFGGFLPTGQTVAFVLAANDLAMHIQIIDLFNQENTLAKFNMVKLVSEHTDEPSLSGILQISKECLSYCTNGAAYKPDYSPSFPAKRLTTKLDWEDLVLHADVMQEVDEIKDWIKFGNTLLNEWGMSNKIKPGYRTLFYGPPGTGKTLTAGLIGKSAGLDVYRIDLSMVVSKFIGETEKNLASVFDQAEQKNWILFFDEADSLFGKRTQTSSSNDKYANQEVSYLLQRIEDFDGVVILSTNIKANLDDAFSRRFQSMIHFPMPGPAERKQLWRNVFSEKTKLEKKLNIDEIAEKYELAGGAIINISRYASLQALKRGDTVIQQKDVLTGIRREFAKDGKIV